MGLMKEKVGEPELLCQCAEECAEMAQAALKLARILRGMAECKAMIRWVAKFYGYDVCGIKLRDRNGRIWR